MYGCTQGSNNLWRKHLTSQANRSSPKSDGELVAAANRGDAGAMEALYYRYCDWVCSLACRVTGNQEDADDVLQEVFFYLFGKFPGFELRCQMKTFLYPVVRNLSIRHRERRARARPLEDGGEPAAPGAPGTEAARRDLDELIAGLPEHQRDVVLLRFADGLSLEEIAGRLAVPLGTVKSRLHKALAELRQRLSR